MDIVEQIDLLLESGAKWRYPNQKEIQNEWDTEYDVKELFDAARASIADKGPYDQTRQREFFLKNWKKLGRVETFKKPPRGLQFWDDATFEDLKKRTNHMRKDVDSLARAMREGTPLPYPLLVKDGAAYRMLGGRTRFGVANILGLPVEAFVLDREKINPKLLEFLKGVWVKSPPGFVPDGFSESDREIIWDWVEAGRRGPFPVEIPPALAKKAKKGKTLNLKGRSYLDVMIDLMAKAIERVLGNYG